LNSVDPESDNEAVRNEMVAMMPRLRRFCLALAGSRDAGDDLMQNTIERSLTRIGQWERGTRLDSWMFRIARNIFIDEYRTRSRRGAQVGVDALEFVRGDDGVAIVEGRSDLARVRDVVANLPDEQRELVALVILEGQSYKEAAAVLDIPIGTVMSRLARARAAIDKAVNGLAGGMVQ
jgi:RNA polymerase sigma-70 factor, ECF subfamily